MNRFFAVLTLFACAGCGLSMDEVKREVLPQMERNSRELEALRREHGQILDTVSRDIADLQLTVATLGDRLKELRTRVMLDLEAQNAHLAEVDRLQLDVLERTRTALQERLKGTQDLIEKLRQKAQLPAPKPAEGP